MKTFGYILLWLIITLFIVFTLGLAGPVIAEMYDNIKGKRG